jgi:predicted RNase H-like nuclease (RuvC/YqgF family)
LQIKNSLSIIHNLTKENKKLKETLEILDKSPKDDIYKLEQISLKNKEIEELKKKIIELNKKYEKEINFKKSNDNKLRQLEEIIIRLKKKIVELKIKIENNNEVIKKANNKNLDISNIKGNKLLKSASQDNIKKLNKTKIKPLHYHMNDNFYQILTDKEKNALKNLLGSNEDFVAFNNKLNILENRNNIAENKFRNEIEELNKLIEAKDKRIENLNKQIEQKDHTIKSLENKLNELKTKNKMLENKNKKILTVEEQLKNFGYKNKFINDKDKIDKLNIIINYYKNELNKNNIQKNKEDEINKINNEIGNIQFFSDDFFNNLKNNIN